MRLVPAAVAAALVLLALGAASVALAATFGDAVGDVIGVGPDGDSYRGIDLETVEVTNTPAGLVTFRLTLADASALASPSAIVAVGVLLDTDRDADTGADGLEAFLGLAQESGEREAFLLAYDAAEDDLVEVTSEATAALSGTTLVLTVPRNELFETRGFDFSVVALALSPDGASGALDFAPDLGDPPWTYELTGLPAPRLTMTKPLGSPLRAQAGKRFTVTSLVTRTDPPGLVTSGTVTCTARVGATRVRTTGRFAGGRARCDMTIPASAARKTVRGTMTVRSAGLQAARPFSARVT